jgi:hypothetical protein
MEMKLSVFNKMNEKPEKNMLQGGGQAANLLQ